MKHLIITIVLMLNYVTVAKASYDDLLFSMHIFEDSDTNANSDGVIKQRRPTLAMDTDIESLVSHRSHASNAQNSIQESYSKNICLQLLNSLKLISLWNTNLLGYVCGSPDEDLDSNNPSALTKDN